MWQKGKVGKYTFEIKVYEEPSIFGINGGRISKLWLMSDTTYTTVAHYERGWDKLPTCDEVWEAVDELCTLWN